MVKVNQHYLGCLAQAGYSIVSDNELFVIDPRRDVSEYVELIETKKLRLVGVMLSHVHADFVAGHQELAKHYNAPLYLGRAAGAEYPHIPITDGMQLNVGSARLEFWETPGHTPGDVSTLLFSPESEGKNPIAVFTGDTLFNGDVGRPDLLASLGVTKEELVKKLYHSVRRLMTLPNATVLYPAHGAGSLCGKHLSAETVSTIGAQRPSNYAVLAKSEQEFAELVTVGQTEAPKYFITDVMLNKRGVADDLKTVLSRVKRLTQAEIRDVLSKQEQYHLVDTRSPEQFSRGFIPGFLNIGLDGWFASWSGTLVDGSKPVVLAIAEEGQIAEAVTRLARVGIESVHGFVLADELKQVGVLASFENLSGKQVQQALESGEADVIDVRTAQEIKATGGIPGAIEIPVGSFSAESLSKSLKGRDRFYIAVCAGGYRSSLAASFLAKNGYKRVADLGGGFGNWPAKSEKG